MSTALTPFAFPETGQPVRMVRIDGAPWFVGKDACDVIGISKYRDAVAQLDEDERVSMAVDTPGGSQRMTAISEPGLFALMLISRSPKVHAFRRWVTHEVLPSIRNSGSYTVPARALPDVTTPTGVLALAEQFVETARQLVEADDRIKELEPKALAHDVLIAAQAGDVLVRQAAKTLGWKERDLRTFLVDEHMLYRRQAVCGSPMWDFYAAHSAHFNATEQVVEHTWGSCAHYTVHVTPAGLALIQKRIERRKAELNTAITDSP
ncbi:BRO family protein [Embleya sp. NPDC005971]|uniref:phage antirepressor n=1 Tax=Embleya sp. NPDC005971 TaxID=3156724 RepID=UPI0033EABC66